LPEITAEPRLPWPAPAIVSVHQLQGPDLRSKNFHGGPQVHRRLCDLNDLDQRTVTKRKLLSRPQRISIQHMRGTSFRSSVERGIDIPVTTNSGLAYAVNPTV
jgi:hypothetical protein